MNNRTCPVIRTVFRVLIKHMDITCVLLICIMLNERLLAEYQVLSWRPAAIRRQIGDGDEECLVEARVRSCVKDERHIYKVSLEITSVYWGDDDLLGKSFDVFACDGPDMNGSFVYPVPIAGEVGIWPIVKTGDKTLVRSWVAWDIEKVELPARAGISKRFENVKNFAVEVSKVHKAPLHDRTPMIWALAISREHEIACWAVEMLGSLGFAHELKDRLLDGAIISSAARGSIDRILDERLQKRDWGESSERFKVYTSWLRAGDDERIQWFVRSLSYRGGYGAAMGSEMWLKIVRDAWQESKKMSGEDAARLSSLAEMVFSVCPDQNKCIAVLAETIKDETIADRIRAESLKSLLRYRDELLRRQVYIDKLIQDLPKGAGADSDLKCITGDRKNDQKSDQKSGQVQ